MWFLMLMNFFEFIYNLNFSAKFKIHKIYEKFSNNFVMINKKMKRKHQHMVFSLHFEAWKTFSSQFKGFLFRTFRSIRKIESKNLWCLRKIYNNTKSYTEKLFFFDANPLLGLTREHQEKWEKKRTFKQNKSLLRHRAGKCSHYSISSWTAADIFFRGKLLFFTNTHNNKKHTKIIIMSEVKRRLKTFSHFWGFCWVQVSEEKLS